MCPSCGSLVGVRDDKCYTCGRANPGLWGFGPILRQLGTDLGFAPLVIGACTVIYVLTLVASGSQLQLTGGGMMSILSPSTQSLLLFGMSGAYPGVRLRVVVDRAERVVAARRPHSHPVQHDLRAADRARDGGDDRAGAHGHHLRAVGGVAGFFLSSTAGYYLGALPIPLLHGAGYTMGASASIFGLLGALVHYGRKSGSSLVHGQAMQYAIFAGVFGLIFPGVDNYAHLGGFLGGYASRRCSIRSRASAATTCSSRSACSRSRPCRSRSPCSTASAFLLIAVLHVKLHAPSGCRTVFDRRDGRLMHRHGAGTGFAIAWTRARRRSHSMKRGLLRGCDCRSPCEPRPAFAGSVDRPSTATASKALQRTRRS